MFLNNDSALGKHGTDFGSASGTGFLISGDFCSHNFSPGLIGGDKSGLELSALIDT